MSPACPGPCGRLVTAAIFICVGVIQLIAGVILMRSKYVYLLAAPNIWTASSNFAVGALLGISASVWKNTQKATKKHEIRRNLLGSLMFSAVILNSTTAALLIMGEGNALLSIELESSGAYTSATLAREILAYSYATSVCSPIICVVIAVGFLSGMCFRCKQSKETKIKSILKNEQSIGNHWVFDTKSKDSNVKKTLSFASISSSDDSFSSDDISGYTITEDMAGSIGHPDDISHHSASGRAINHYKTRNANGSIGNPVDISHHSATGRAIYHHKTRNANGSTGSPVISHHSASGRAIYHHKKRNENGSIGSPVNISHHSASGRAIKHHKTRNANGSYENARVATGRVSFANESLSNQNDKRVLDERNLRYSLLKHCGNFQLDQDKCDRRKEIPSTLRCERVEGGPQPHKKIKVHLSRNGIVSESPLSFDNRHAHNDNVRQDINQVPTPSIGQFVSGISQSPISPTIKADVHFTNDPVMRDFSGEIVPVDDSSLIYEGDVSSDSLEQTPTKSFHKKLNLCRTSSIAGGGNLREYSLLSNASKYHNARTFDEDSSNEASFDSSDVGHNNVKLLSVLPLDSADQDGMASSRALDPRSGQTDTNFKETIDASFDDSKSNHFAGEMVQIQVKPSVPCPYMSSKLIPVAIPVVPKRRPLQKTISIAGHEKYGVVSKEINHSYHPNGSFTSFRGELKAKSEEHYRRRNARMQKNLGGNILISPRSTYIGKSLDESNLSPAQASALEESGYLSQTSRVADQSNINDVSISSVDQPVPLKRKLSRAISENFQSSKIAVSQKFAKELGQLQNNDSVGF